MSTNDDFVFVDLDHELNNTAITHAHNLSVGRFNIWKNSYPAEELPAGGATVSVAGVPFRFPPRVDGGNDNVVCDGQLLTLPPGRYDWIYVLGAAERRTEDHVYLHFTDGAVDPEWLRISDFWPAPPHFGEVEAFRCRQLHYPRHVQENVPPGMWRQRLAVTREAELARLRLPDNPAIHLFAMTLVRAVERSTSDTARSI